MNAVYDVMQDMSYHSFYIQILMLIITKAQ